MSNHLPKQNDDNKLPNQPFLDWLKSQTALFIGQIIGLASTAYLFFALFYYSHPHTEIGEYFTPSNIQGLTFGGNIAFILLCILKLVQIIDVNNIESSRAKTVYKAIFNENIEEQNHDLILVKCQKAVRRFKLYFILFWISMLALYISLLFVRPGSTKHLVVTRGHTVYSIYKEKKDGKQDTINFFQTIPVDSVETQDLIQDSKTKLKDGNTFNRSDFEYHSEKLSEAIGNIFNEFIIHSMNIASMMFIFWCFTVLYLPPLDEKSNKKQIGLIYLSIFIAAVLIISFPLFLGFSKLHGEFTHSRLISYVTLFDAISGTLSAVTLALLIARLDSKLIALPSLLVGILYLYAAVQPLFVAFDEPGVVNETIKTSVLLFVFILKIYFFFIILYALQTGRMLNYLLCFPTLNKRIDDIFENKFVINILKSDHNFFTYTFYGHGSLLFSTDNHFSSRDTVFAHINSVRMLMEQRRAYKIREVKGACWIDVVDGNGKRICFSVNMESVQQAEDLIEESIAKIRYCKLVYS